MWEKEMQITSTAEDFYDQKINCKNICEYFSSWGCPDGRGNVRQQVN